jgi:hypothetical protein
MNRELVWDVVLATGVAVFFVYALAILLPGTP